MNLKRYLKILSIALLLIMICFQVSYASDFQNVVNDMKPVKDGDETIEPINTIIGILQYAGTGISIIVVSLLGIKYIVASVEERAEIKKQAIPIVIGCILLFGAVNIMTIVEKFSSNINSVS